MADGAPKQLSHVKYAGAEKGSSWAQRWGTHFNRCFEQEEKGIGPQLWADGSS